MGLEELNENLHKRDFESSRDLGTGYDPGAGTSPEDLSFESQDWHVAASVVPEKSRTPVMDFFARRGKLILVGFTSVVFILVVANLALIRGMLFDTSQVSLSFSGPRDVASAETVTYVLSYENRNILGMKNAEVALSFPDSFKVSEGPGIRKDGGAAVIPIGDIAGKSVGKVEFSGKFYGSKGELVYPKATLRYTPSGVGSAFETDAQIGVTIASSPLTIDITAPQEIASGSDVEYIIGYQNDGDLSFSNLRVKAEYPDGFRFGSSDPVANEGNAVWKIGNLLPRASGTIRIKGNIIGIKDQAEMLRVSLGVLKGDDSFLSYDQRERVTRIITSPLSVVQTVNGKSELSVNPGDSLNYKLRYTNEGNTGLRDVIVTLEVNAAVLDLQKLSLNGKGAYDAVKGVITWRAPDLPELSRLEPGQGGEVSFSVGVRNDIGSGAEVGKNLTIRTVAKIDSPDVPLQNKVVSSNTLEVRIGAVVAYDVKGLYFDTALPNSGPVPPKVGSETTYTIHLKVTDFLNDLAHAKVTTGLPTGVRYVGKIYPETESLTYNDRTGDLVWDIGSIFGGGNSSREVRFQVAVTPGPSDVGRMMTLLRKSSFDAVDLFTKQPVHLEAGEKTTSLSEDTSIQNSGYNVTAN
jgi:hypothetical protein